ncbi:TPA: hypothetical protein NIB55_004177 [Pseudomonas aeruginosa]|nr:hypothetical protein [Pseudomonas aeruginosa]
MMTYDMDEKSINEKLVKSGLRTIILVSQTSMKRKQITAIRKQLGLKGSADSGPLPHSETILGSREMILEATLFMQAYLLIAQNPAESIDNLAVISAHAHYLECHGSLRGGAVDQDVYLDLDRAWVIARDYRAMNVSMRSCNTCHTEFVASSVCRRFNCPLCSGTTVEIPTEPEPRSLSELAELSNSVSKALNWGSNDEELCSEIGITLSELTVAKALSTLSPRELRALVASEASTSAAIKALQEQGSLQFMVA